MGQKIHATVIRLGITQEFHSHWYTPKAYYSFFVSEDHCIRTVVTTALKGILSRVQIERRNTCLRLRIYIHQLTSIFDSEAKSLQKLHTSVTNKCNNFRRNYSSYFNREQQFETETRIQIFVRYLKEPIIQASYLAERIASDLEKRTAFRRAIRSSIEQAQALAAVSGVRVQISGRLNGVEIARVQWNTTGSIPLLSIREDLDFSRVAANTIYGLLGVKVWVLRRAVLY